MYHVEITIKMFKTEINVINFASILRDNVQKAKNEVCILSPAIFGHGSVKSQERLYDIVARDLQGLHGNKINGYGTAMRKLSRDVHYPGCCDRYTTLLLPGSVDLPAATSTTEIKDGLDFEAVVRHYFWHGRGILSPYFAEQCVLFVFDTHEEMMRRRVVGQTEAFVFLLVCWETIYV